MDVADSGTINCASSINQLIPSLRIKRVKKSKSLSFPCMIKGRISYCFLSPLLSKLKLDAKSGLLPCHSLNIVSITSTTDLFINTRLFRRLCHNDVGSSKVNLYKVSEPSLCP